MKKQETIIIRVDSELRQMINSRLFAINEDSKQEKKITISAYIRGLVELDLLKVNSVK